MTPQVPVHSDDVVRMHQRLLRNPALQGRRVDAGDGRAIHVTQTGDGPPLVLLHGGGAPGCSSCRCSNGSNACGRSRPTAWATA